MTMVLLFGAADEAKMRAIREYAEIPANYYSIAKSQAGLIPGKDPHFTHEFGAPPLGTLKVVFTVTRGGDGHLYRHLSVSGTQLGRYGIPGPDIVSLIATEYFGFSGSVDDWGVSTHEEHDSAINVFQRYVAPGSVS